MGAADSRIRPSPGEDVSFLIGSGWEAEGNVGRVIHVAPNGDVTVHYRRYLYLPDQARIVPAGTYARGAIRYCDRGRESAMDYAGRIAEAIAAQNCRVREFDGDRCPACGAPRSAHAA